MKNRKIVLLLIPLIAAGILLTGCQKKSIPADSVIAQEQVKELTYQGQDGKSVYDVLKENHQVEADESDLGVMVKSIDGVSQTDSEFWLYDVNGEQSNLSADKQQTKSSDVINWQLKNF